MKLENTDKLQQSIGTNVLVSKVLISLGFIGSLHHLSVGTPCW